MKHATNYIPPKYFPAPNAFSYLSRYSRTLLHFSDTFPSVSFKQSTVSLYADVTCLITKFIMQLQWTELFEIIGWEQTVRAYTNSSSCQTFKLEVNYSRLISKQRVYAAYVGRVRLVMTRLFTASSTSATRSSHCISG
jgi:hypothetical protein